MEAKVFKYKHFSIKLPYNDLQKAQYAEMQECQKNLKDSDYKAAKYSEGLYTEEEYAPIKAQRQAWRDRYNEINEQFTPPSLTDEEAEEVISKWEAKHPKIIGGYDG